MEAAGGGGDRCVAVLACAGTAAAAKPDKPDIDQPAENGVIVSPADVHMEAYESFDRDGDEHACSDWKIQAESGETAWEAPCATGVLRNHIHLGDGDFVGNHEGRSMLRYDRHYVVVVRFRDSAGEVSPAARRAFRTSRRGPPGEPSDVPWETRQSGYEVERIAGGLQLPTGLAFVPDPGPEPDDPLLYVTELYGTIKVVARDGSCQRLRDRPAELRSDG